MSWPDTPKRRTYSPDFLPSLEEMPKPPRVVDLTGREFGAWTVLGYHGRKHYATPGSFADYWRVKCSCGTVTRVQGRSLVAETSRQCVNCAKGMPLPNWMKPTPR